MTWMMAQPSVAKAASNSTPCTTGTRREGRVIVGPASKSPLDPSSCFTKSSSAEILHHLAEQVGIHDRQDNVEDTRDDRDHDHDNSKKEEHIGPCVRLVSSLRLAAFDVARNR